MIFGFGLDSVERLEEVKNHLGQIVVDPVLAGDVAAEQVEDCESVQAGWVTFG